MADALRLFHSIDRSRTLQIETHFIPQSLLKRIDLLAIDRAGRLANTSSPFFGFPLLYFRLQFHHLLRIRNLQNTLPQILALQHAQKPLNGIVHPFRKVIFNLEAAILGFTS